MTKTMDEDRLRRRQQLEQKRAARRAAKEQHREKADSHCHTKRSSNTDEEKFSDASCGEQSYLLKLPEDALQVVFCQLSAVDLGCLTATCTQLNRMLPEARVPYLVCRLNRHAVPMLGGVGFVDMCSSEATARDYLEQSYGGGDTGRIVQRGKKFGKTTSNEFVAYARFLEEAVCGHSPLTTGAQDPIMLPKFLQGRFVSTSPEHSLCRVGGDGSRSGPGSGVASWGVGKRGQLGHGTRQDERLPRRLMGGLGYGIRIVQVSAGGGLVRVAHSLLLTSTGRVLSFGTGQYGSLGHGYSKAKQLPDMLRPQYVEALSGVRCVCVAAGELHSAVVSGDGDVYTWGDSFCGQCGHGDKRPQLTPKQVTAGGLEDECVASVSCGSRHTLVVTDDGEVFSWGLGHFGVLGRSFTPFEYDADEAVVAFTGAENIVPPPPAVAAPGDVDETAGASERERNELMEHLELIANLSLDDSSDQCIPKRIDSLEGINIVGCCAGHRHSLVLDGNGGLYSFGAGNAGCLGHGDSMSQMHPMKIMSFQDDNVRIMQMSAGVDMCMAVSTTGDVYAWGKTDGGRIGLAGPSRGQGSTIPRRVSLANPDGSCVKAVDVECGYVHSVIVGLDGRIHLCGGVGVEGEADGSGEQTDGGPKQVPDFNIWHRLPEPTEFVKKERWKKFGKYEVKGRTKMMDET